MLIRVDVGASSHLSAPRSEPAKLLASSDSAPAQGPSRTAKPLVGQPDWNSYHLVMTFTVCHGKIHHAINRYPLVNNGKHTKS